MAGSAGLHYPATFYEAKCRNDSSKVKVSTTDSRLLEIVRARMRDRITVRTY